MLTSACSLLRVWASPICQIHVIPHSFSVTGGHSIHTSDTSKGLLRNISHLDYGRKNPWAKTYEKRPLFSFLSCFQTHLLKDMMLVSERAIFGIQVDTVNDNSQHAEDDKRWKELSSLLNSLKYWTNSGTTHFCILWSISHQCHYNLSYIIGQNLILTFGAILTETYILVTSERKQSGCKITISVFWHICLPLLLF